MVGLVAGGDRRAYSDGATILVPMAGDFTAVLKKKCGNPLISNFNGLNFLPMQFSIDKIKLDKKVIKCNAKKSPEYNFIRHSYTVQKYFSTTLFRN